MAELEEIYATTRNVLQPLISKPKLSDKLLGKPPFRFLHDIVTNLHKATGFADGLYTDDEMDSSNIKDKQSKLDFLTKIVACVGFCLNEEIDVRPAKAIAGLEPECTNTFLQALAKAASDDSIDVNAAVQKVLGGGGGGQEAKSEAKGNEPDNEAEEAAKQAQQEEEDRQRRRRERKEKEAREREKREAAEREAAKEAATQETKDGSDNEEAEVVIPQFDRPPTRQSGGGRRGSESEVKADNGEFDNADTALQDVGSKIEKCTGDVEVTKELISAIITRPKMASKLLNKPPLRFLHDVISEVTKATGFAEGLYGEEEQDYSNIKDKQAKMAFMDKIISCVGFHLNVEISARSAKIVAGLEPEHTNRLLQLLAVAATSGKSSDAAVQRVLSGERVSGRPSSNTSDNRTVSKESNRAEAKEEKVEEAPPTKVRAPSPQPVAQKTPAKVAHDAVKLSGEDDDDNDAKATPASLVAESKDEEEEEEEAPKAQRPTTARRRPPKLKENTREVKQAGTNQTEAPSGIMLDGDNMDSDDEEEMPQDEPQSDVSTTASGKHGKLVRNILEDQSKDTPSEAKGTEDTKEDEKKEGGIRLGKRRKSLRDTIGTTGSFSAQDINELRHAIQKLCQASNPLGKCLEYVHEDIESMNRELEHWRSEYYKNVEAYEDEKRKTDELLQPLQFELAEVDEQVKEQRQKITSIKTTIAKNDVRVQQLLRMVM